MERLARLFLVIGVVFVAIGLLLQLAPSIPWLGRLPGDIRIEREGLRLYLPLTSCLVVSAAVSLVLSLLARWR